MKSTETRTNMSYKRFYNCGLFAPDMSRVNEFDSAKHLSFIDEKATSYELT